MKLSPKLLIGVLGAILTMGACRGDLSPAFDTSESGTDTIGMTSTTGDASSTGEDPTSGEGSGSTTGDDGSTGGGTAPGMDMGGSGETGEPTGNPWLWEPCDPVLAANGTAPCEGPMMGNANDVWVHYTCGTVVDGNSIAFECLQFDGKYFGMSFEDPSPASVDDMCSMGSVIDNVCMNSGCMSNGGFAQGMPLKNFPAGHCDNVQTSYPADMQDAEVPLSCCTAYCNDDNPCDEGFTCWSMENETFPSLGRCLVP